MPIYRKVDKDFFKTWSPQMAYVLGFFFADGSYDINPRGSEYFSFQITDRELLVSIKFSLKSNHSISTRLRRKTTEATQYRLQIGSKEMCRDLRALGVCTQKASTMKLPTLPSMYFGDFVRGYFDGDGNVWMGLIHKDRKKQHMVLQTGFTSASDKFLQALYGSLKERGLSGGGVYCKNNAFCLKYSTSDSLLLHDIMYLSDSELFLKRKRIVFERFIKERKSS